MILPNNFNHIATSVIANKQAPSIIQKRNWMNPYQESPKEEFRFHTEKVKREY